MEKEIIKKYKNLLADVLSRFGIPDSDFTIKAAKESHPSGFIGWYKSKSAFTSRPIFYVDFNAHEEVAKNSLESIDEVVLSTLLHEYAHVIEEKVQNSGEISRNPELSKAKNLIINTFTGNEDFAEDFALYLMGVPFAEYKKEAIKEISKIYAQSIFSVEDIEFGKKDKWEKEIIQLMNKNQDFLEKLSTPEGSFDQCRRVCEIFFERMSDDVNAKIIRLEGFNGDVDCAHKKWKKIGAQHMVHYALLFNDDTVYDFTYNQFKPNSSTPVVQKLEEYLKNWDNFSYFANKSTNKKLFHI